MPRRSNTPPSDAQHKIIQYIKVNPGCSRKAISKDLGLSLGYIGETIAAYLPHLSKPRPSGDVPSALQAKILKLKKENMNLSQKEIGRILGASRSMVCLTISAYMGHLPKVVPTSYSKKIKEAEDITIRSCLRCGKKHKSTWAGDRYCSECKKQKIESPYLSEYGISFGYKSKSGAV